MSFLYLQLSNALSQSLQWPIRSYVIGLHSFPVLISCSPPRSLHASHTSLCGVAQICQVMIPVLFSRHLKGQFPHLFGVLVQTCLTTHYLELQMTPCLSAPTILTFLMFPIWYLPPLFFYKQLLSLIHYTDLPAMVLVSLFIVSLILQNVNSIRQVS